MKQKIEVAVFPVAGMGTRFLPITKAIPKEMLPILNKPLIQYVVEEALLAGIKELVFVTNLHKGVIENYFDTNYEIEARLEQLGKYDFLSIVKNILPKNIAVSYVRQKRPLGLGDAILSAKHLVANRPFAVLLPDDIIDSQTSASCMQKMVKMFEMRPSNFVAVEEVNTQDVHLYGIVSLADYSNVITSMVEKPDLQNAPSNLAVIGRYILTPRIFEFLEKINTGINSEIQLTDALSALLTEETVMAFPVDGTRYDCGTTMGFLEATIAYALKRTDLRERLQERLSKIMLE